ncbi:uncharacterized protein LOC144860223 [Branchiostoma floridae x Branchiostoma japonicum]
MYEQAVPVRSGLQEPDNSQPGGLPPQSPCAQYSPATGRVRYDKEGSNMVKDGLEKSSNTYEEAERVRYTKKDQDVPPTSQEAKSPQAGVGAEHSRRHCKENPGRCQDGIGGSNTYEEAERVTIKDQDVPSTLQEAQPQQSGQGATQGGGDSGGGDSADCKRHGSLRHPPDKTTVRQGAKGHRDVICAHRFCLVATVALVVTMVTVGPVLIVVSQGHEETSDAATVPDHLPTWSAPPVTSPLTSRLTSAPAPSTLLAKPMTTSTPVLPGSSEKTESLSNVSPQTEGTRACGEHRDCADLYEGGSTTSGVYMVTLQNNTRVEVYCDMDTDGGGWTVIQRRFDGSVPFNRTWADYKRGFGNLTGEHWLGNDNLHLLTNQRAYRLRIDWIRRGKQNNFTCTRGIIKVADEKQLYRMTPQARATRGNMCDLLFYPASGFAFSTVDRDNDIIAGISCAEIHGGGWWYVSCGALTFINQQWNYHKKDRSTTVEPVSLKLKP